MKLIALTKGAYALVDDADVPLVAPHKWHLHSRGYAATKISGETILMHRILCDVPDGKEIDHADGNPLNNQRNNLRPATHTGNMQNRKRYKNNRSGYKGVTHFRGKWKVEIKVGPRRVYLGCYADPLIAAQVYDTAVRKHYGEFARPNFSEL